jgi:hypothetical protein
MEEIAQAVRPQAYRSVLEVLCSNLDEANDYLRVLVIFKGPVGIILDQVVPVYWGRRIYEFVIT